ncbi:adenylate kinase, chloroplastic [Selaginella moellendorffii]|nr:adenylate kinase, chloroplastic [Selaginella moellendorffii]|eukprot:XP_002961799.2 adenylate kinase, chloroplastic [Selaginella moellendorffii]
MAMAASPGASHLHARSGSSRSPANQALSASSIALPQRCIECRISSASSPSQRQIVHAVAREPLKVMISGAPASGKGTQCELITDKYGLVHIAAGDLLRAEVAAGTENGIKAQEYMNKGQLVPNEIVVSMVKRRLEEQDAQEKGWLLDGYPRSVSQAEALEALNIRPHVFILLQVPEDILVERVVGRRLDPVTGKIYHLTYAPPETPEIEARLTQRSDDTEERVKLRLKTHRQNVEDVLSIYSDVIVPVDGNRPKTEVFSSIDSILNEMVQSEQLGEAMSSS